MVNKTLAPKPLDDRMFRACVIMEALAFLRNGEPPDKAFMADMRRARNAFAGYVSAQITRYPTSIVLAFSDGTCLRFKVREIKRTPLGVLERVEYGDHGAQVWSLKA